MRVSIPSDPLDRLSWAERRRWRTATHRLTRAHEADQLVTLRWLAGQRPEVTSIASTDRAPLVVGPVQIGLHLGLGRRRLVASRVHSVTWLAVQGAWVAGGLALADAGRYGRGWTLTFEGPLGRLVVLAERLLLHPFDDDGPLDGVPPGPEPASRSWDIDCYPRGAKAPEPQTICIGQ